MDEKETSHLDAALKHHSSAQAAIQALQEQLDCLDELRKSTREASALKEEEDLEKSTVDLLTSTHRYLLDSSGNKRNSPSLSSTVNYRDRVKDESVIRNLLPSFGVVRNNDESLSTGFLSPIKSLNHSGGLLKDSFASTTLPPTPVTTSHLPTTVLNGSTSVKSSMNSSRISPKLHQRPNGSLNLSEVLARLVYGSTISPSAHPEDSIDTSDELLVALEKIAKAGQELQVELQNAKARESRLMKEVYHLRSKTNGYSPHHGEKCNELLGDVDVEEKCRKLEDAMLSLQDQNLKLNKKLKESSPGRAPDELKEAERHLLAAESENRLLQATIDRMKAQLAYYEERHVRQSKSSETLPCSTISQSTFEPTIEAIDENRLMFEEKIKNLESELAAARVGMANSEELHSQIKEMHATLKEKNNYIDECKMNLQCVRIENKELSNKCEELQQKDVYKRKEVLLLCDKFEQIKSKNLRLEEEVKNLRRKRDSGGDQRRSAEESLRKFLQENEALHSRLIAEQRELSTSKSMLEKDYVTLKDRYDALLSTLLGVENKSRKKIHSKSRKAERKKGISLIVPDQNRRSENFAENSHEDLLKSPMVQSNLHHKRHHTTPGRSTAAMHHHLSPRTPKVRSHSHNSFHQNHLNQFKEEIPAACTNKTSYLRNSTNQHPTVPQGSCGVVGNQFLNRTPIEIGNSFTVANDSALIMSPEGNSRLSNENFFSESNCKSCVYRDEYTRNMGNSLRSQSCDQLGRDTVYPSICESSPFRSRSEILSTGTTSPLRKRLHTAPSTLISNLRASPLSVDTPYTSEYLTNMDGVGLLVSIGNNERNIGLNNLNDISPANKSILKPTFSTHDSTSKFPMDSTFTLAQDTTLVPQTSSLEESTTFNAVSTPLPSLLSPSFRFDSSAPEQSPSSSESNASLHLSDLPSDQATIADKFRNFDDYKQPPPVVCARERDNYDRSALPSKQERSLGKKTPKKKSEKPLKHAAKKVEETKKEATTSASKKDKATPAPTRKKQNDAVDQSSASTTRDHVGRIEFLRDIQINSGMRLPGVVADASIRDAVLLNDSELNGEVRLGLSDNQEAYAEKLVKKYTKNAGKILNSL